MNSYSRFIKVVKSSANIAKSMISSMMLDMGDARCHIVSDNTHPVVNESSE